MQKPGEIREREPGGIPEVMSKMGFVAPMEIYEKCYSKKPVDHRSPPQASRL
ncbi:MAG: hypothetical protein HPY52_16035 [Firmicutes bacterium]|nr:hypothetical protein [Bacillota bacterium]